MFLTDRYKFPLWLFFIVQAEENWLRIEIIIEENILPVFTILGKRR
ncbi:MAG: hypothetical protein NC827_08375 [Candidatus Omnitrophica bacterium]|nr:hypothetical protein [Candidatus Omnitrophota bacterium]MCM8803305.1 hypothetical protein [Candidatus Omnitrophota bacterium]